MRYDESSKGGLDDFFSFLFLSFSMYRGEMHTALVKAYIVIDLVGSVYDRRGRGERDVNA